MELILLSYPEFFAGESCVLCSLMEHYSFTFHLRKPKACYSDYLAFLQSIPKAFHNRIVLHDAYDLQDEFEVKGVHFSTRKRGIANSIQTEGSKSTSCHSVAEARELDGDFDYVFLSPVFSSISKHGYEGNLDMHEVKAFLLKERKTKIIALGGLDERTIPSLASFKFDGMAILGAVWTNNPQENKDLIKANFLKILD